MNERSELRPYKQSQGIHENTAVFLRLAKRYFTTNRSLRATEFYRTINDALIILRHCVVMFYLFTTYDMKIICTNIICEIRNCFHKIVGNP